MFSFMLLYGMWHLLKHNIVQWNSVIPKVGRGKIPVWRMSYKMATEGLVN